MSRPGLLLDECVDYRLKGLLSEAAYDTEHCLDLCPGEKDRAVAELALQHERILITHDKGFVLRGYGGLPRTCGILRIQPALPASMF